MVRTSQQYSSTPQSESVLQTCLHCSRASISEYPHLGESSKTSSTVVVVEDVVVPEDVVVDAVVTVASVFTVVLDVDVLAVFVGLVVGDRVVGDVGEAVGEGVTPVTGANVELEVGPDVGFWVGESVRDGLLKQLPFWQQSPQ